MINSIVKKTLFIFNILVGLFIISYTIYRRMLIIRLPKDLHLINDNTINYSLFSFILISVILCGYILIKNILILLHKEGSRGLFYQLSFKLNNIIENALKEVYSFFGNSLLPDPYNKISFLAQKFYKYFKDIPESFFLFTLYFIRLIILICFLSDVFIFFRLKYMYIALYLLLFSLLIKTFFYMLKDFAGNLEEAKSVLIIEEKGINDENNLPRTSFSLKEEFKNLDLEYHVGQYILCSKISGYLEMYDRFYAFFTPYFNCIIYLSYLIGWCYVLLINFLLLL